MQSIGAKTGRDKERDTIIHQKLKDGTLKLYELEKELSPIDAIRVRRGFIEQETGTALENIGIFSIDVERVVKRNCENMIGAVQVPLGVAGPVLVNGGYATGNYWLPLATTEGALVASVNRGCSAITKAGRSRGADPARRDDPGAGLRRGQRGSCGPGLRLGEGSPRRTEGGGESTTSHGKLTDMVTFVAGPACTSASNSTPRTRWA